ncbi:MAG: TfuA-like protein [Pseudomonadota bacterium]
MGEIVVFAGPTISEDAPEIADCDLLFVPPAAQGDIYAVTRHKPWGIVLIDGHFDWVPAPWHREILWAISLGIHVFGAASIGALRAADLDGHGMIGVGAIYDGFATGRLTDDDEVAVLHGPRELDYPPLSEAMVNIRASLEAAAEAGVLPLAAAEALTAQAKALPYRARTAEAVFAAADEMLPDPEPLRSWWATSAIDQKRSDAVLALREAHHRRARAEPPPPPALVFQPTDTWATLVADVEDGPRDIHL